MYNKTNTNLKPMPTFFRLVEYNMYLTRKHPILYYRKRING